MASLRGLDLNLLLIFEALHETRSVSRAGTRLGLSQSAASHALARLREACRDELFLRAPGGMVPTPLANRIYPEVHKALDSLRHSVDEARGFDPATSTRRFRLAIPHPMGPVYALRIRDTARAEAPNVSLRFDTRTLADEAPSLMREGDSTSRWTGSPPKTTASSIAGCSRTAWSLRRATATPARARAWIGRNCARRNSFGANAARPSDGRRCYRANSGNC